MRYQTHSKSQIFRNLYHGVTPNLFATPLAWSFNLFAYHYGLKIFTTINNPNKSNKKNYNHTQQNNTDKNKTQSQLQPQTQDYSLLNVTFAGIFAGFAWSVWICPFELVKCYSQRFHIRSNQSIIIVYNHLGLNGIYRGLIACLFRDMPVSGIYFTILETLRHNIPNYDDSRILYPFLTGAVCGIAGCAVGLPADCVKSHIQTNFIADIHNKMHQANGNVKDAILNDHVTMSIQKQKTREVFSEIVNKYGILGLYRGGLAVCLKCVVGAGTAIMTMEYVNKLLYHDQD